ncbi:MFS transporter [Georgenia faecalis]|uniref:MFS transporter n=1 Tax=Georgenia faecalis TaxID=2483799 RepID=UPI0013E05EF2|nr:MFS transporter [Georgenia faecalis]
MKRPFSFGSRSPLPLLAAGTGLIAATYGLVRLAYGLVLPNVQDELGLGVAAAGVVSGGASVLYCAGAVLGFLTAARHARALVVVAALSAALGATGMALAPSPAVFAVAAIVSSAGAGLASPALVAALQDHPATRRHPRAQSIVNAGTGPGLAVAGALALALLPSWRVVWVVAAVVTLAAGAAVLLTMGRGSPGPTTRALPPASWFTAHWRVLAAALLMGAGSAAVWNYGRAFLVDSGAGDAVSVTAWIALGAGGTAVAPTARWVSGLGAQRAWVVTTGTLAAASAALALAPDSTPLALAACAAFGWGYTAGSGALIAWTVQIDAPRAPAGTALAFVTLILGQAAGASTVGALVPEAGYPAAFLGAAVAAAAATVPALTGPRSGQPDPALSHSA